MDMVLLDLLAALLIVFFAVFSILGIMYIVQFKDLSKREKDLTKKEAIVAKSLSNINSEATKSRAAIEAEKQRAKQENEAIFAKKLSNLNAEATKTRAAIEAEKEKTQQDIVRAKYQSQRAIEEARQSASRQIEKEKKEARQEAKRQLDELAQKEEQLTIKEKIINDKVQSYPYLANLLAQHEGLVDDTRLHALSSRAWKADEIVRQIKAEKKELILKQAILFNQLQFYEAMFPWLEEFKQVPTDEAIAYIKEVANCDEGEYFRQWLSPEEYNKLSPSARLQRSLDKWKNRKKTDWEVGIEYERYIGYLYEKEGYTLEYSGALQKLEDMGRDLVAIKGDSVKIIQCKRWKQDKQIHEKHIFQLYGTTILYSIQHPHANVTPVFVTTATLSPTAKQCADRLNVVVVNKKMADYPLIKCNINRSTQERIYHLPFDQQYDRIIITPQSGEFYANTVEEAEKQGFRHAFKHCGY